MQLPAEPCWLESQPESLHQTQCDSIRVVTEDGELLGETTINPAKGYQQMRKPPLN